MKFKINSLDVVNYFYHIAVA